MDPRDESLRDAAKHRGFKLLRSRRRKPGGDFGKYGLADGETGKACLGVGPDGLSASYEEVQAFLRGQSAADGRQSVSSAPARAKPKSPPPRRGAARPAARKAVRKEPPRRGARGSAPPTPAPAPPPPAPPPPPPAPPPAPELVVRKASAKDAEALAALLSGIGDAVGATEMARRIERARRGGEPLIVADRGGLVGCAEWHVVPLVHRLDPVGRIASLFVVPGCRNRGIGTALLEAAEAALKEKGCGTIEAMSAIEFDAPHGFFRKAGYRQTAYRFTRGTAE